MRTVYFVNKTRLLVIMAVFIWAFLPDLSAAHCDSYDGPVITTAKAALAEGDVAPVLKWVKPEQEQEIKHLFDKTLAVSKLGADARDIAETHFFETLVRVHRAGEGQPFTGLKPAGQQEPIVMAADAALNQGSVGALDREIVEAVKDGLQKRYTRVMETKPHADESPAAGREYVEAYVDFVHFVERLHGVASGVDAGHEEAVGDDPPAHQH